MQKLQNRDLPGALKQFRESARFTPNPASCSDIVGAFRRLNQLKHTAAATLFKMAEHKIKEGDNRGAIPLLEVSDSHKHHPQTYKLLGVAYERLGQLKVAAEYYLKECSILRGHPRTVCLKKVRDLKRTPCELRLASRPGGALVTVNGQAQGRTPGAGELALRVAFGRHKIELVHTNHAAGLREVTCEYGEGRSLAVKLIPFPLLRVESRPPRAEVSIDGRRRGRSPLAVPVAPGEHRVVISAVGYSEAARTCRASPGSGCTIRVELQKPARGLFVLGLAAPTWASAGDPQERTLGLTGGLRAGALLRWPRWGLQLDLTYLVLGVEQLETETQKRSRTWFSTLAAGGGMRFYVFDGAWIGAGLAAGVSVLHGDTTGNFFFGSQPAGDAGGAQALFSLRAELTAGWTFWRGLTVTVTPLAVEYNPRIDSFAESVERVVRVQIPMVGLGWQYGG